MIATEGPKVVYWLGAGASANALPVVDEMPNAFDTQALSLNYLINVATRAFVKRNGGKRYANYLHQMARWSIEYGTIDTYARSLYLLGKRTELAELKLHIGMFFLLVQALRGKTEIPTNVTAPNYEKRDRVDTRYMGWLALLMERESALSQRVSVVNWNYDLQIEQALATYRGYKDLSMLHSDPQVRLYPRPVQEPSQYNTPPSFIRLNGIAGHARMGEHTRVLYDNLFDTMDVDDTYIQSLFRLYNAYDEREQHMLNSMSDTLTFAWEENEISREAKKLATLAMIRAQTLVVIGYSFPSFNRVADKALYEAFASSGTASKRVVLQNGSMSPSTFQQMMGKGSLVTSVEQEPNLMQFYIPPELF